MRKLLLPFSLLLLTGCVQKEVVVQTKYVKRKCPLFEYNVTIPKSHSFTIEQKNGKIVISKRDFTQLVKDYSYMKEELNGLKNAIDKYNKNIKRMNNEKH